MVERESTKHGVVLDHFLVEGAGWGERADLGEEIVVLFWACSFAIPTRYSHENLHLESRRYPV